MKISIIVGTRPEIIKMSPIIRECIDKKINYFILHTGQHYTYELDKIFFEKLELPVPKYKLDIGSSSHGEQTGKMIIEIEKVLKVEKPDVVLVQGDTNTVLAGSIAAKKLNIKVGHIEAGLRSYDKTMPEEINRILSDHCSDFLFAPTKISKKALESEGIHPKKIFVTGNTIADAINKHAEFAEKKSGILKKLGVDKEKYFLVTVHRQENVDDEIRFKNIIKGLSELNKKYNLKVIFPIHPRSRKKIIDFKIDTKVLTLIEPVDFFSFLTLEKNAKLVLTDSGGIQEETCIMRIPCITLRDNTERPETIEVGSNILAGTRPDSILKCVDYMYTKTKKWNNPFGNGKSSEKIIKIING